MFYKSYEVEMIKYLKPIFHLQAEMVSIIHELKDCSIPCLAYRPTGDLIASGDSNGVIALFGESKIEFFLNGNNLLLLF